MKKIRNILSIALVFVMLIGFAPVNVFAQGVYKITITKSENGSVTARVGGTDADEVPSGATVTLTEKPDEGYELESLTVAGTTIGDITLTGKTFIMPGEAVTVTATFKKKAEPKPAEHEIKIAETKNGTVEANTTNAAEGATVTLTEKPDEGYELESLTVAGTTTGNVTLTDKTFKMPGEDVTVTATFKKKAEPKPPVTPDPDKYTIYTKAVGNGTVTTDVSESKSEAGKTITVSATPAYGYVVDRIVVTNLETDRSVPVNYTHKSYFNDYPYYLRSRWYDDYPYDYDDYIRWCDRNGYSRYDSDNYRIWCRRYGYRYDYDDFRRWDDVYGYRWYNRYDYSYYDKAQFTMPASHVRVTVTFTSAPYWYDGYYYDYETGTYRYYYDDDYYYYRNRRNKKSNYYERQAEKDKKEEETKVVEEKKNDTIVTKAVISIGSNMIDKVSNDLHTKRLMDAPAYVKDGRVMLPLRFVAEALGLQVSWIKDNRTVVIQDMLFRVEIPVDTNNITVNGVTTTSDVKPEIVNGRVMLPIANIARALGLVDGRDIVWNAATKEVTLTRTITK